MRRNTLFHIDSVYLEGLYDDDMLTVFWVGWDEGELLKNNFYSLVYYLL